MSEQQSDGDSKALNLRCFAARERQQSLFELGKAMVLLGVDGCRGGWFFVRRDRSHSECGLVGSLEELIPSTPEPCFLFIDIPIGLRSGSGEPRPCDIAARRLLGSKRASSVFPAPVRGVLQESDYPSAVATSRRLAGKGISRQTFAIVPKIRELDELLARNMRAREMVREIHPELCFWALNGGRAMQFSKKCTEGFAERMDVLKKVLPEAETICETALAEYLRKDVARDDIVDALAALATAAAPVGVQLTVPSYPERDACGLPMQMVYALAAGSRPS